MLQQTSSTSSPPKTPAVKPQKRVAAQPYQQSRRRTSGSDALAEIASLAADFNGIMSSFRDLFAASAAAPTPATSTAPAPAGVSAPTPSLHLSPQRRTEAIITAQKEMWLVPKDRVALINILRDVSKADIYNALETEEIRVPWVIDELQQIGVHAFHPLYSNLDFDF